MPTPELVYTVTTFHNFGHTRERAVELVEVNVGKLNKLFLGGILTNCMVKKGQSNFLAPFGELVVNILNLSESESCRVFKAVLLLPRGSELAYHFVEVGFGAVWDGYFDVGHGVSFRCLVLSYTANIPLCRGLSKGLEGVRRVAVAGGRCFC